MCKLVCNIFLWWQLHNIQQLAAEYSFLRAPSTLILGIWHPDNSLLLPSQPSCSYQTTRQITKWSLSTVQFTQVKKQCSQMWARTSPTSLQFHYGAHTNENFCKNQVQQAWDPMEDYWEVQCKTLRVLLSEGTLHLEPWLAFMKKSHTTPVMIDTK